MVCQALVEALQAVSGQSEGEWLAWAEVQHCLGGVTPGDSLLGVKPSHVRAVQVGHTHSSRQRSNTVTALMSWLVLRLGGIQGTVPDWEHQVTSPFSPKADTIERSATRVGAEVEKQVQDGSRVV